MHTATVTAAERLADLLGLTDHADGLPPTLDADEAALTADRLGRAAEASPCLTCDRPCEAFVCYNTAGAIRSFLVCRHCCSVAEF